MVSTKFMGPNGCWAFLDLWNQWFLRSLWSPTVAELSWTFEFNGFYEVYGHQRLLSFLGPVKSMVSTKFMGPNGCWAFLDLWNLWFLRSLWAPTVAELSWTCEIYGFYGVYGLQRLLCFLELVKSMISTGFMVPNGCCAFLGKFVYTPLLKKN